MIPQVGDTVLVLVDRAVNNNSDVAPGVLTHVWSSGPSQGNWGAYYNVNAKAFLDASGADQWLVSAGLYADEASARACLAANPGARCLFPKTAEIR